jgi:8-oxo-dGTP diphosphatase
MISVAYFGEVPENTIAIASDDAKEVAWFAVNELPNLAFDHQEIIEKALKTFKI